MYCRIAVLALVFSLLLSPTRVFGQGTVEAFHKDILKLLDLTGSSKMGIQMANMVSAQFLEGLRKGNPDVPGRAIDVAKELLSAEFTKAFESPDGLTPQLVTIYAKHFTHQEVLGLIAFYETDLGKKTVATMPQLMQEAGSVGQQWAERNVPRILSAINDRLRAEGFIKSPD